MRTLEQAAPASAVSVGAGYIGLEMADALTVRGLHVTQMEQLGEVLPTVDPQLGALVHAELASRGVEVLTGTTVQAISTAPPGGSGRLQVQAAATDGMAVTRTADVVLVVVGVRPETALAAAAGATLGSKDAIAVDPMMRTGLPDIYAAGDVANWYHPRLERHVRIEEILRVTPIGEGRPRITREPIQLGETTLPAGEVLFLVLHAANHDPSVFPDARAIRFDRDMPPILSFGRGIHACLGQQIARMELQVLWQTLLTRLPTVRLAVPPSEVPWRENDTLTFGPAHLPVTW